MKILIKAVLFVLVALMPFSAMADEKKCAPLKHDAQGYQWDASYSAHKYSKEHVGNVGISIFPGADLKNFTADELGLAITSSFKKHGVEAQCFVNQSSFPDSGTALGFKIDGLSIKVDGDDSFNMKQVRTDKRIIKYAISEAKMVKRLLSKANENVALGRQ